MCKMSQLKSAKCLIETVQKCLIEKCKMSN